MKKFYLLFVVLLYLGTGELVKTAEESEECQQGSLVNKNEKNSVYCIVEYGHFCNPGPLKPGGRISFSTPIHRLYLWDRNLVTELEETEVGELRTIIVNNSGVPISEINFPLKPHRIFEPSLGFNKTIHLKLKGGKLEPQQGKNRLTADGYSLENNIDETEIRKYTLMFSPDQDSWVRSKEIPSRGSLSRIKRSLSRSLDGETVNRSASASSEGERGRSLTTVEEEIEENYHYHHEPRTTLFFEQKSPYR